MVEPLNLPPGQAVTNRFPVVGERVPADAVYNLGRWRLSVEGLVRQPFSLTWDEVLAFPHQERTVDIHCVTGWTQQRMHFVGIPLAELVTRAGGTSPGARFVRFEAHSSRRHDTSIELDVALADTWLVDLVNGGPLSVEHGFPLRAITPSRYFYKSCKWVHRIEFLAEDRLGYWERESAYHNVGDPSAGHQRFATGSIRPAQLDAFRAATDLRKWRERPLIGLDLSAWAPATADLRKLALKGCDLRGANLAGCDLRETNLSLSDLRGANLRGANLRGADIEGADFRGADLTDADLRKSAACATKFVGPNGSDGATVKGMRWAQMDGLLEVQENYLRAHAPHPTS